MTFLRDPSPESFLRLGLGAMYVYSGIDFLIHPRSWVWAVTALPLPIRSVITGTIGTNRYLMVQGIGELAMALVLLGWFMPRRLVALVAGLAAFEMAAILLFVGIDAITFRDIGLLGAAAALAIILLKAGTERLE